MKSSSSCKVSYANPRHWATFTCSISSHLATFCGGRPGNPGAKCCTSTGALAIGRALCEPNLLPDGSDAFEVRGSGVCSCPFGHSSGCILCSQLGYGYSGPRFVARSICDPIKLNRMLRDPRYDVLLRDLIRFVPKLDFLAMTNIACSLKQLDHKYYSLFSRMLQPLIQHPTPEIPQCCDAWKPTAGLDTTSKVISSVALHISFQIRCLRWTFSKWFRAPCFFPAPLSTRNTFSKQQSNGYWTTCQAYLRIISA